jgi:hypothetical protein
MFWDSPLVRLVETALRLKMGPTGCSETSVRNANSTLRKIPRRAQISFTLQRKPEVLVYLYFAPLDIANETVHTLG